MSMRMGPKDVRATAKVKAMKIDLKASDVRLADLNRSLLSDQSFRQKFEADPAAVLAAHGIQVDKSFFSKDFRLPDLREIESVKDKFGGRAALVSVIVSVLV